MKFVVKNMKTGLYMYLKSFGFGAKESLHWVDDINQATVVSWLTREVRYLLVDEEVKRIPVEVTRSVVPIPMQEDKLILIVEEGITVEGFTHGQVLDTSEVDILVRCALGNACSVHITSRAVVVGKK